MALDASAEDRETSRIDLDHVVLLRIRVQRELTVAAAFDLERADDPQGCRTKHLIFAI